MEEVSVWGIEWGDVPLEHDGGVEERGGRDKGCGLEGGKRGKKRNGKRLVDSLARELRALGLSGAVLPMVP